MSDETKPWYTFDSYDSLTYSIPDDGNEDNKAVINNSKDDFSIDISLTETSNFELFYNFMIINEGKYSISSYLLHVIPFKTMMSLFFRIVG